MTTINPELRKLIVEAMQNAIDNGYQNHPDNVELANDLQMCDADIEKYDYEEVLAELNLIRPFAPR